MQRTITGLPEMSGLRKAEFTDFSWQHTQRDESQYKDTMFLSHNTSGNSKKFCDHEQLMCRFPHALNKHQILGVIRNLFPGISKDHQLILTIHDSFDFAFENGFSQGYQNGRESR